MITTNEQLIKNNDEISATLAKTAIIQEEMIASNARMNESNKRTLAILAKAKENEEKFKAEFDKLFS